MLRFLLTPFRRFFQAHAAGHYRLERHSLGLAVGIIAAASVGGIIEIAPLFTIDETVEDPPDMRVYTPLEQAGRDIYIREGCYFCHSQMIRTLADEVDRYGHYSLAVESQYDHPMLWGSKRTGPDLARIGGKYSDYWHVQHLLNPRELQPESLMPAYAFLMDAPLEVDDLPDRLAALRAVGVPYTDEMVANAAADALAQARPDSARAQSMIERYGEGTNVRTFDGIESGAANASTARPRACWMTRTAHVGEGSRPADRARDHRSRMGRHQGAEHPRAARGLVGDRDHASLGAGGVDPPAGLAARRYLHAGCAGHRPAGPCRGAGARAAPGAGGLGRGARGAELRRDPGPPGHDGDRAPVRIGAVRRQLLGMPWRGGAGRPTRARRWTRRSWPRAPTSTPKAVPPAMAPTPRG